MDFWTFKKQKKKSQIKYKFVIVVVAFFFLLKKMYNKNMNSRENAIKIGKVCEPIRKRKWFLNAVLFNHC